MDITGSQDITEDAFRSIALKLIGGESADKKMLIRVPESVARYFKHANLFRVVDIDVVRDTPGDGARGDPARRWGAREVIGIDLSAAVETAFAATRSLDNAHIIQADIYHLPLARKFDYAFSVGVLHHLPDPRAGFLSLAAKVKPGGHLSAWIYGAENNEWITRWINPVREKITSRINRRVLLQLSKAPAACLYLATKLVYGPLNKNGSPVAKHLFYNDYLSSISNFGWREQHTIVFDHLVAPTSFYLSREEFESWWRDIGAADVVIGWHNKNSWRGTGVVS
jgi:SAM-dependent methyltransferase